MTSTQQLTHRQALSYLIENYRLFETYYEDYQVSSITYQGEEYHFLDLLDGIKTLSKHERLALFWVYIDQKSTTNTFFETSSTIVCDYLPWLNLHRLADKALSKLAKHQDEATKKEKNDNDR